MAEKTPYDIIKRRHITEKAMVLQELKNAKSNRSLARFENPKYVFVVDRKANKKEIAVAIEEIYKDIGVKVVAVNTINVKPKPTRQLRTRGGNGSKSAFKKAIVTLEPKDDLDK
jgi:large subunit ribosomal protein L23